MFSVVYGVLLRPLPYPEPEGIVRIADAVRSGRQALMISNRAFPLFEDAESFEHIAAYRASSLEWMGPDGAVTLRGAAVSPALFPLLRATPQLGRVFTDGGSAARCGPRGAAQPPRLDQPLRVGSRTSSGLRIDLGGEPATPSWACSPEGVLLPEPGGRVLDAARRAPVRPAGAPGAGATAALVHDPGLHRPRPPRPRGVAGTGDSGGRHPRTERSGRRPDAAGTWGARGRRQPRSRAHGWCLLLEEMVGEYRPAIAGPDHGDGARAADRLRQRGGPAARARRVAPADAGGLRGHRGRPRAARPPAA